MNNQPYVNIIRFRTDSQDQGFNFTSLPESHVRKLVEDIAKLPTDLQDKLITTGRLEEIDVADIYSMFPTNIVPAFTVKTIVFSFPKTTVETMFKKLLNDETAFYMANLSLTLCSLYEKLYQK